MSIQILKTTSEKFDDPKTLFKFVKYLVILSLFILGVFIYVMTNFSDSSDLNAISTNDEMSLNLTPNPNKQDWWFMWFLLAGISGILIFGAILGGIIVSKFYKTSLDNAITLQHLYVGLGLCVLVGGLGLTFFVIAKNNL